MLIQWLSLYLIPQRLKKSLICKLIKTKFYIGLWYAIISKTHILLAQNIRLLTNKKSPKLKLSRFFCKFYSNTLNKTNNVRA